MAAQTLLFLAVVWGSGRTGGLEQQLSERQQLAATVQQYLLLQASISPLPLTALLYHLSLPCHFSMYFVAYLCNCNKAFVA